MSATDHGVIEASVKAKRQQQQSKTPPRPAVSPVNRAITAGIWVAAAGTLAAVFLA